MSNYARSILGGHNLNRDLPEETPKISITSGGMSIGAATRPPVPQHDNFMR